MIHTIQVDKSQYKFPLISRSEFYTKIPIKTCKKQCLQILI